MFGAVFVIETRRTPLFKETFMALLVQRFPTPESNKIYLIFFYPEGCRKFGLF